MAHEVETMFSARVVPWHRLGKVTDRTLSAAEAYEAAGLDWQVETVPIAWRTVESPGASWSPNPNVYRDFDSHRAIIRTDTNAVLGVAGSGYRPVQNWDLFEFTDLLLDDPDGRIRYETAGALREGRHVWAMCRLDDTVTFGGQEEHLPYLCVSNWHDGTGAFKAFATAVRVVCANTYSWAEGTTRHSVALRHTRSIKRRIDEARHALELGWSWVDSFRVEVDRLLNTPITDAQFAGLVDNVAPIPPFDPDPNAKNELRRRNAEARRSTLGNLWYESPTIANIRNTGYGAINVVSEYEQWFHRVRGGDDPQTARAARTFERTINNDWPMTSKARQFVKVAGGLT